MRSVDTHKVRVVLKESLCFKFVLLPHSMRSENTHKVRVMLMESLCFEFVLTAALYAQCGHPQSAGDVEAESLF